MLSLLDFIEIDNLIVYRDDQDPRKFYLLPDQPQIPLDEEGVPEFLLIHYIKDQSMLTEHDPGAGGYLQFRTSLAIPTARRELVVSALRQRLEEEKAAKKRPFDKPIESTEPLLASPLWMSGEVQLHTFGVRDDGLVLHAVTHTLPDLGGDLAASFAIELSNDGAEIFWSAFNDADKRLPIMVAYKLMYKAGVTASMEITASQHKVWEGLWQQSRPYVFHQHPFPRYVAHPFTGHLGPAQLLALRRNIPSVVAMINRQQLHKTIRSAITVNIRSDLGSGPEAEKSREMLMKIATDVLSERIIPLLFGSAVPLPGAESTDEKTANHELHRLGEDPPDAPGKNFTITINQSSTVERSVNPNGSLRVIIPADQQEKNKGCFRELRLTDGFFSMMRVRARPVGVDFARDGISAIHVKFRYDQVDDAHIDRQHVRRGYDGVLDRSDAVVDWRFDLARSSSGGHKREYEYQTTVFYAEGIPQTVTSWTKSSDRELAITPQTLRALRVELLFTARKEWVEGARVHLHHEARSGGIYDTEIELGADAPKKSWFQFTGDLSEEDGALSQPAYRYQVSYRTSAGELRLPVQSSTARTLEIPSPFKRVLRFTFVPQGFTEGVSNISGDMIYEDSARDYRVVKSFVLDKPSAMAAIDVPILEDGPEAARLVARVNYGSGTTTSLPPGRVQEGTNLVGVPTQDFLSVEVVPLPDLDFEHDLALIMVTLSHDDPAGAGQPKILLFKKGALAPQSWRVPLTDPRHRRYSYTVQFIAQDRGKSTTVRKSGVDEPVLLLDRQASLVEPFER